MLNLISDEMQAHFADPAAKMLYMVETFKKRMRALRKQAGFDSQEAAANAIGCDRGTVGMWEAPSSKVEAVGGEYLLDVARAYKVRPEYINSGEGSDGFPWEPGHASHPLKLDAAIVKDAAQALHEVFAELGYEFHGVQDVPELFVDLYQNFASGEARPYLTAAKIGQWIERHQGKGSDGRVAAVPDEGIHSGKTGRGRKVRR